MVLHRLLNKTKGNNVTPLQSVINVSSHGTAASSVSNTTGTVAVEEAVVGVGCWRTMMRRTMRTTRSATTAMTTDNDDNNDNDNNENDYNDDYDDDNLKDN
jgi:hypothetical protein